LKPITSLAIASVATVRKDLYGNGLVRYGSRRRAKYRWLVYLRSHPSRCRWIDWTESIIKHRCTWSWQTL